MNQLCSVDVNRLTHWAWFCRAACIWGLWWLVGCRWNHSLRRPRRSRSTPSSSPSPPLREWSLRNTWNTHSKFHSGGLNRNDCDVLWWGWETHLTACLKLLVVWEGSRWRWRSSWQKSARRGPWGGYWVRGTSYSPAAELPPAEPCRPSSSVPEVTVSLRDEKPRGLSTKVQLVYRCQNVPSSSPSCSASW